MTTQTDPATTAVTATTTVEAPIERAFAAFTGEMERWWPKSHHIIEAPLSHMTFETRLGGRVIDVGTDGSECAWARVLAWEPPHRFVISWDITTDWKLETDHSRASEVEVRFTAETADRTRVELEHRHLDRHGEGWPGMRAAVGASGGWPGGLELLGEYLRRG